MQPSPQFPVDLVTFTGEILDGKLHFLCRGYELLKQHKILKRKGQFLFLCNPKGPKTSWAQTIFPWDIQGTQHTSHPAFTVNNGITTTMYKICSTLTIMTSRQRHWTYVTHCFGVSIVGWGSLPFEIA